MPFNPGNKRAQRARNVPTVGGPMKFGLYPTVGVSLPFLMKLTRCCGPKNAACSGKREAVVACGASVQVCKACNVPLTCPADAPRGSCVSQEDIHKQVYPVVKGSCEPAGFAPRYCRDCCNKAGKGPGNGLALGPAAYLKLQEELIAAALDAAKKRKDSNVKAATAAVNKIGELSYRVFFANGINQPPTFLGLTVAQKEDEWQRLGEASKQVMSAQIKNSKDTAEGVFAALKAYADNFIQEAEAVKSDIERTEGELIAELEKAVAEIKARQVTDAQGLQDKETDLTKAQAKLTEKKKELALFQLELARSISRAIDAKATLNTAQARNEGRFSQMNSAVELFDQGFVVSGNNRDDALELLNRANKAENQLTKIQADIEQSSQAAIDDFASKMVQAQFFDDPDPIPQALAKNFPIAEDFGGVISFAGDSDALEGLTPLPQDLKNAVKGAVVAARDAVLAGGHAGADLVVV